MLRLSRYLFFPWRLVIRPNFAPTTATPAILILTVSLSDCSSISSHNAGPTARWAGFLERIWLLRKAAGNAMRSGTS
ncbi:hypothetical protein V8C44DRAFT_295195 [Trichoderma aethiopicum]